MEKRTTAIKFLLWNDYHYDLFVLNVVSFLCSCLKDEVKMVVITDSDEVLYSYN